MSGAMTEIRWHARAGQGAVTAANLVAESALAEGRYFQAMPEFGPERMGAPLKAFTRLSDEPIEVSNNVEFPDIVVVLDDTLLAVVDVAEGMAADGVVIVNTPKTAAEIREQLNAPDTVRIALIDATTIALEVIKRNIPNTPIVGALAAATGVIQLDSVLTQLEKSFGRKFSQRIIDVNLDSVRRAYEEVEVQ
ncbi:MAG: 2-oxoacid:acceptor oxidoreductase family protein [Coriobacteriia bacterium]|nr:2-oxoacid:acceptor oxidoreductase family protein [Coriobacteriia bacterium]